MKFTAKVLVCALMFAPGLASALEVINYSPAHVFAPVGFDSNDNSQLVLAGTFPNTCYKVSEPSVALDKLNKRIYIQDKAVYHKGVCLYMLVPYYKTVNLGALDAGDYEIMLGDIADPGVASKGGELKVAKATTESPDDFLYAPVEEVTMNTENNMVSLTMRGNFSKSCLQIKEVKVNAMTSPDSMIIVQPIAEEDGTTCTEATKAFETTVVISNPPTGKTLLHIRSLNGQAINRVVNL